MTPSSNPFAPRVTVARRWEDGIRWLFRLSTYIILACGLAIFGTIVFKGSSTVFSSKFPFVDTTFLGTAPETLHVFQYEGQKREMGDREFRAFSAAEAEKTKARGEKWEPIKVSESIVYSSGGIFPCIVGTVLLVVGSMTIALFLGVSAAIYLSEYANPGPVVNLIRLSILNLAGVPSIVFGLFGFGLFVLFAPTFGAQPDLAVFHFRLWPLPYYLNFNGWNVSLLAGWFTLAFMVLPVVITASEESLKAVPKGFREGSLALGATKWMTIRKAVLPYALPGILTSSILGIARVAGETAPIMFTAAYVVRDKLPWEVTKLTDFFFQGVMALPYHIYVVSSKIPQNEYSERVQYGTAFVFLVIVAGIALTSILLRNRLRRRYQW
ncbi:phosphate ABC transporter permease PstA [Nibricoccus sp. IMCC34717]|uniref:phosphate ABC transporter permease PstA n=1 Tax=Nibricoccus sp. IMCC34717 TaxID=3034021 RepID=UPI00384E24D5